MRLSTGNLIITGVMDIIYKNIYILQKSIEEKLVHVI